MSVSSKPLCPICDGPAGKEIIRIETVEFLRTTIFPRKNWYLVRRADAPGICKDCRKNVDLKRYVADVFCLMPLVFFFIFLTIFESKFLFGAVLAYIFYLVVRGSYTWVDFILYGSKLRLKLDEFRPLGGGRTCFPCGRNHVMVRILFLPVVILSIVYVSELVKKASILFAHWRELLP